MSMLLRGTFLVFPSGYTPRGIFEMLNFLLLAKYINEPMYRSFWVYMLFFDFFSVTCNKKMLHAPTPRNLYTIDVTRVRHIKCYKNVSTRVSPRERTLSLGAAGAEVKKYFQKSVHSYARRYNKNVGGYRHPQRMRKQNKENA